MRRSSIVLILTLYSSLALGQEPAARILTLDEALRAARASQPQLRQARAGVLAAQARSDQAFAPLLPQVSGTAGYQHSIGKSPPPVSDLSGTAQPSSSVKNYDNFRFDLTARQLIYDFGQTTGKSNAAKANAESQRESERTTLLQIELNVRVAYFDARAAKAMVTVARETLANQERHLGQIQGFVEVGSRPEIDLAQVRADQANARVQLINAENNYESAKAQLNQAMGVERSTDYDVADETLAAVDGEDKSTDALVDEALKDRPEFAALSSQVRAQELTIGSIKGGYWPSLGVSTGLTESGRELGNLAWNWNAQATLSWQIFQGGQTRAQVDEARANLAGLRAQMDALRQQVRLEVEQARLAVRAAIAALAAAGEVTVNTQERLKLAEGRYQTGVGNIIELADAQLALTGAEAQQVQAEYNLSSARAKLLKALGRP